jgi:hypothetical protein
VIFFLPIERDEEGKFFVIINGKNKPLIGQITIYKKNRNEKGYTNLGSLSTNRELDDNYQKETYYVKNEDKHLLIGGSKTKRWQYRYRASSKNRVASRRRNVSRRSRGRQSKYSRRK